MAAKKERTSREPRPSEVVDAVAVSKRRSSKNTRDGRALYGVPSEKAFGVPVRLLPQIAKTLGRSHELAEALWRTGPYEARMLATFVAEPARVTALQMERWCRDFDNWPICDTARIQKA